MYVAFFLLFFAVAGAAAQTSDTINIRLRSGETVPYLVSAVSTLSFSGVQGKDTLKVLLNTGNTIRHAVSNVEVISFSPGSSTDSLLIGLTDGKTRAYPVSSLSTLYFIDWNQSSSTEPLDSGDGSSLLLGQNFPNPFFPVTTIPYFLPESREVTVAVYTLEGRLVTSLVRKTEEPGYHQVAWDGSPLPEGIYICKLTAGKSVLTRRMTMMKR